MTAHSAIIFGASGYLGSHLRRKFVACKIPYISVSRRKIEGESPSLSFDFPALQRFVQSHPAPHGFVVFNLVGSGRERLSRPLIETNFELAKQIISFSRSIGAKRSFMSAASAFPTAAYFRRKRIIFRRGRRSTALFRPA
jgi:nucleoside-diphosphate-sugar epimerase